MRVANLLNRAALITGSGAIDVDEVSEGRFSAEIDRLYLVWGEFVEWADALLADAEAVERLARPFRSEDLAAPVVTPRQIFAVGLNYAEHAQETNLETAERTLVIFTKFASSLTGPEAEVRLPNDTVDWEVELAAVIGTEAYRVEVADAWSHVAGLAVSQDLSERTLQMTGAVPQFSLAKSYPGFSPVGPWLVTTDELGDRDDIELGCSVNGTVVQSGSTGSLIFSIPEIVSELSAVLPLLPGDLIFTGTPSGVGMARNPPVYLKSGDVHVSWADQLGELRTTFI